MNAIAAHKETASWYVKNIPEKYKCHQVNLGNFVLITLLHRACRFHIPACCTAFNFHSISQIETVDSAVVGASESLHLTAALGFSHCTFRKQINICVCACVYSLHSWFPMLADPPVALSSWTRHTIWVQSPGLQGAPPILILLLSCLCYKWGFKASVKWF